MCERGAERRLYALRQASLRRGRRPLCLRREGGGGTRDDSFKAFGGLDNHLFPVLVALREHSIKCVSLGEGEKIKSVAGEGEEAANVLERALAKRG